MSVCQFFGVGPADRAAYVEQLGTTRAGGTRPSGILDMLSRLEVVTTSGSKLEMDDLARFFRAGQPVLCPIQLPTDGGKTTGHWVAVTGVGLGQVFVQDPASGPRMIAEEDWLSNWFDVDSQGVRYDAYGIAVGEEMPGATEEVEVEPEPGQPGGDAGGGQVDDGTGGDDQQRTALVAACRRLAVDGVMRMVRRVGHHAKRAAQKPETFLAWLDRVMIEHQTAGEEIVEGPLAILRATGVPVVSTADTLLADLRDGLLEVSGRARPADLEREVSAWLATVKCDPESLTIRSE